MLRIIETVLGEATLSKLFLSLSTGKGSTLQGRNFLFCRIEPFHKGVGMQESK